MSQFTKPAESAEQLLARLEARGLQVPDRSAALAYLTYVGGYRLKGFWFHLTDPGTKKFRSPTTFDEIAQRYEFDRQLRKLTFDEIGRIEVAARCSISNHLSQKHGPHWFIKPGIFLPNKDMSFGAMVKTIEDSVRRSKAVFITHYKERYDDPYLPPSWGMTECATFGFWSRTYQMIRDLNERKAISMKYRVDQPEVFESWLHSLAYLRNMTCHHSRLLGAKLVFPPSGYKKRAISFSDSHSFYARAAVISYLVKETGMPTTWKSDLRDLFSRFPAVKSSEIGFAQGWETKGGW